MARGIWILVRERNVTAGRETALNAKEKQQAGKAAGRRRIVYRSNNRPGRRKHCTSCADCTVLARGFCACIQIAVNRRKKACNRLTVMLYYPQKDG